MKIERRSMVTLLAASAAALIGSRIEGQSVKSQDTTTTLSGVGIAESGPIFFALALDGSFAGFKVLRHGKEITISSDEIWAALGGQP